MTNGEIKVKSEQKNEVMPRNNLGFGDNKTIAPQNMGEMIGLLAQIMSHALNNTLEIENAKVALNAATRIIEAQQADTRMKALAIASGRAIEKAQGWQLVGLEKQIDKES